MFSEDGLLGCPCGVDDLRNLNDRLNAKVVDQLNESQELVMINSFARDTNEYQFRNCLQERIADIASWRWVFEDLSKRLDEAIGALHYEHNALKVVLQRIQQELHEHSREGTRPGALCPMTDIVESAILEEYTFLCDQKNNFEKIISELEKQIKELENTKKKMQGEILKKQEALSIDESCANNSRSKSKMDDKKKKRKRCSTLDRWENRCSSMKQAGLQALNNAVITRQQVRGARVHLSIASQACSAKVDAALRRRLHANTAKLEELCWQREEAMRDIKSLEEELSATEQNFLETMAQEQLTKTRIADRMLRPPGELTRDEVDKRLRNELGRLKHFMNHLRSNIDRISSLQNNLLASISRIDCVAEDVSHVIQLDRKRMSSRGENSGREASNTASTAPSSSNSGRARTRPDVPLSAIVEENEDDYPFDE